MSTSPVQSLPEPPSPSARLRELIQGGLDAQAAAEAYVLHHPNEVPGAAMPYFRSIARSVQSSLRRQAEQSARAQIKAGTPMAQARRELAETHFLVPGHGYVAWNDATVEQHRMRVVALRGHVESVEQTIALHEEAIAQIEAAGVACLNELAA